VDDVQSWLQPASDTLEELSTDVVGGLPVAGVPIGLILLVRKPFRAGDLIRTNDFEGTVEDIDLRVTRLIDYDGELILIPNRDVYTHPLVNLTRRGVRRTTAVVGVDYRDDHDRSVNFEVRYRTAADIRTVRHTQDRVLATAKRGIQDAGMTIPWPIRTLVVDGPINVDRR
jgi:small-conductance mechanosensitive channel